MGFVRWVLNHDPINNSVFDDILTSVSPFLIYPCPILNFYGKQQQDLVQKPPHTLTHAYKPMS